MSALERMCNYTLYSPLQDRINNTNGWLAVLILLEIITAIAASIPLCLYYRLDRAGRARLWPRFLPFFSLLLIGAVAGIAAWSSYMQYLVAIQITTFDGQRLLEYDSKSISWWYTSSYSHLVTYFVFYPIEFSCFAASKMFVLERLLTFGTSSMGQSSSNRAHSIFRWLLTALFVMFVVITMASWTSAAFAAPFSQSNRGLNLYDQDRNNSAIEEALGKLFVGIAILFITVALALVTAAFGCALFCFYCFRRIQQVSLALLNAQNMSTSKAMAVEATLRKTRVLIMGTSVVVALSFIVRAAFQILYGVSFTANFKLQNCSSQCEESCQGDLFLLQAILRYSPVVATVVYGVFQCCSCILAAWAMIFNQRSLITPQNAESSQRKKLLQTIHANDY